MALVVRSWARSVSPRQLRVHARFHSHRGRSCIGVWWPGDWQRTAKDQATKLYRMCMESKGYVRECEMGSHWNDDRDKCKRPIR